MKQPENKVSAKEDATSFWIDIDETWQGSELYGISLAQGRTRQSALKAAERRLERLIRDIERMQDAEK